MKAAAALLMGAALAAAPATARSTKAWDDASGYVRDALAVAALGVPAVQGDWRGDLQAGESLGVAEALALGAKAAFPEERPDHSDRKSFPSGHSALSFAAAATLQNRYGWQIGLPAQIAAAFVGLGRVEARKHHWYDVAAGAGIGEASGFLLTHKRNARVDVLPWGDASGGGVALTARF